MESSIDDTIVQDGLRKAIFGETIQTNQNHEQLAKQGNVETENNVIKSIG